MLNTKSIKIIMTGGVDKRMPTTSHAEAHADFFLSFAREGSVVEVDDLPLRLLLVVDFDAVLLPERSVATGYLRRMTNGLPGSKYRE